MVVVLKNVMRTYVLCSKHKYDSLIQYTQPVYIHLKHYVVPKNMQCYLSVKFAFGWAKDVAGLCH